MLEKKLVFSYGEIPFKINKEDDEVTILKHGGLNVILLTPDIGMFW
ncbi:MAG: hypothetical protein IPN86_21895 [Saprospiraceae bacterium]|mgnify:FL=1|nr:hypothetical protein [Saprospiraceae bacterium]